MNSFRITRKQVRGSIRKLARFFWATAIFVLVCFVPLSSQTQQGSIRGTVLDQTGGAVGDATVTVTDVARGIARSLVTDNSGEYVATNLTPGTYSLRAQAKGFRTVERASVLV